MSHKDIEIDIVMPMVLHTPLHLARFNRHEECYRALKAKGARLDAIDLYGQIAGDLSGETAG